jgi:hypothetical protein
VSVPSRPNGLPNASTVWPTCTAFESPSGSGRDGTCPRTASTARSWSGASSTTTAGIVAPEEKCTRTPYIRAGRITCEFVTIQRSSPAMKPVPVEGPAITETVLS